MSLLEKLNWFKASIVNHGEVAYDDESVNVSAAMIDFLRYIAISMSKVDARFDFRQLSNRYGEGVRMSVGLPTTNQDLIHCFYTAYHAMQNGDYVSGNLALQVPGQSGIFDMELPQGLIREALDLKTESDRRRHKIAQIQAIRLLDDKPEGETKERFKVVLMREFLVRNYLNRIVFNFIAELNCVELNKARLNELLEQATSISLRQFLPSASLEGPLQIQEKVMLLEWLQDYSGLKPDLRNQLRACVSKARREAVDQYFHEFLGKQGVRHLVEPEKPEPLRRVRKSSLSSAELSGSITTLSSQSSTASEASSKLSKDSLPSIGSSPPAGRRRSSIWNSLGDYFAASPPDIVLPQMSKDLSGERRPAQSQEYALRPEPPKDRKPNLGTRLKAFVTRRANRVSIGSAHSSITEPPPSGSDSSTEGIST